MTKIPVLNKKNSTTLSFVNYVIEKLPVLSSFYFYSQNCFLLRKQSLHGLWSWDEVIPPSVRLVLSLSMGVGVPGCQPSACHTLSLLDGSVRSKMKMKRMRRWRRVAGTSCRRFSIA